MRSYVMFWSLLLMASACRPKERYVATGDMMRNIPDSVISFDSMVNITCDIHLAEALASESRQDSVPKDERLKVYYGEIFHLYNISSERYKRSYDYYVAHPVLMQEIYAKVTDKLNILESENATIKKSIKNE